MKMAGSNVTKKHFRLQPEYKGTRQIRVTVCSFPIQFNRDVLAAYMSAYGSVEELTAVHLADRMTHGDFVLNICLNREGFQAISHMLTCRDQQIMVVVEGRRLLCWSCKQLGHLSRVCPQKANINSNNNTNIYSNINNNKNTCQTSNPAPVPENHRNKSEEKNRNNRTKSNNNRNNNSRSSNNSRTRTCRISNFYAFISTYNTHQETRKKEKQEKEYEGEQPGEMETSTNLKRRGDKSQKNVVVNRMSQRKKKLDQHHQQSYHSSPQQNLQDQN